MISSGPYGVGKREKIIKKDGYSLHVSIFYPIEKEIQNENMFNRSMTSPYYTPGVTGLKTVSNLFKITPLLIYSTLTKNIYAINNAPLHKDFVSGNKKLTPVVSSHGLMGHRHMLYSHMQEMTSYGCIVYSCDHTDGSNGCSVNYAKNPPEELPYQEYELENSNGLTQEEFRQNQLDCRVNKDIATVIELIKEEAKSGKWSCIDLQKMVAFGHSMGGMTSVHMAYTFPKDFKLCLALDIYFKAKHNIITRSNEYYLTQPLCISTSAAFHGSKEGQKGWKYKEGYDCKQVTQKFFNDTCSKNGSKLNYNLLIPDSSHQSQYDT